MITHDTKVGDEIEYDGEKGKVTAIMGGSQGKVAVVEISVRSVKTVYVAMPAPPTAPIEPPIIEN